MIVVDASAIVEAIAADRPDEALMLRLGREPLHAPHLVDVEVLNALRALAVRGAISADRAAVGKEDFQALDVSRYPHAPILDRVWELRANLSAYDASYVALAEALSVPLVTTDARIANAPGLRCEVEVYPRSP